MNDSPEEWDVFSSHASEDKEPFVRDLAVVLRSLNMSVWYDEFTLRVGDSISRSIARGLSQSTYGVVVISPHFIEKPWPQHELRGLITRDIEEDGVILPIWHRVTHDDVMEFSPPLADKMALNTTNLNVQDIAIKLLRRIRPDLYSESSRTELERLVEGASIQELKGNLEEAREKLSEYRCPYCSSQVVTMTDVPLDERQKHWALHEVFECGHTRIDRRTKEPCPADPCFPEFGDFELRFEHHPEDRGCEWICYALGKTERARQVSLTRAVGRTKDEAERKMRQHYERAASLG